MKIILNQSLVMRLSLEKKPIDFEDGKLTYQDNKPLSPYIVFDNHRDAPTGFGVKIAKTKKTYIIQRRVSSSQVVKAKVGNVSDFSNIDVARDKAREMALLATSTKRNPNQLAKDKASNEITLSEAFSRYRLYLTGKSKPATKNTLKVFDAAFRRLSDMHHLKIQEIKGQAVIDKFDSIAKLHRTAAEQTFRWANVATKMAISMEEHNAASNNSKSSLTYNPFHILTTFKKYRSSSQLEESYQAKGIRKPLTMENMNIWLSEIVKRRRKHRTGCDYLLLTTLWGTRKTEALNLQWRDMISDAEAESSSWVCLKSRTVHFYDTKNRTNFNLPVADSAYEILMQRKENRTDFRENIRKWVFPSPKIHSKTGHYSDMKTLVKNICSDAGITRIGLHDLRRTFGRIAEELVSYTIVKKLLNHNNLRDITSRYTDPEPKRLLECMQKIEYHILNSSPSVYNLFKNSKSDCKYVFNANNNQLNP